MAISVLQIIRNSLKFSAVRGIAALIGVPATVYAATILTPEEYGEYGFLMLWLMYASLVGPGISIAGQREVPVLLGRGKEDEALAVQNVSISTEMVYTIVPVAVIVGASFFFSETVLRFGLIIVAASYAASRLAGFWHGINFVRERFSVAAKGQLIAAGLAPVIILAAVNWLGVYALLIGPLIAGALSWAYYLKRGSINYHLTFNRTETWRLLKVGVVLQALTFVFWAFRLTDRTVIASMLTLTDLGLYTYAIGFLMYALVLSTDFGNVLQPILWREASRANSILDGFADTKRIAVYIAIGVSVLIPVTQLVYYLVMNLITTEYIASIDIFYVLSYDLYLASIVIIPGLILNSSIANRQNLTLGFYAIGLVLNIVFDLLVVEWEYGVVGVAWVTICTQGLVTVILYYSVRGYIFKDTVGFLKFSARIVLPFLLVVPFYFIHKYLDSATSSLWTFTIISLAAQVAVWSLAIGVFYRDYLSFRDLKTLVKEIQVMTSKARGRFGS